MQLIGLARLGRDAECKYTSNGKAVANLSLAFNHGMKDSQGERPVQWIDASLWGDRAEKLTEYLTKGKLIFVSLTDPHIEYYEKRDGGGRAAKMVAMVNNLEFAGGGDKPEGKDQQSEPAAAPAPKPETPREKAMRGIQDMEDEIPFANPYRGRLCYVV